MLADGAGSLPPSRTGCRVFAVFASPLPPLPGRQPQSSCLPPGSVPPLPAEASQVAFGQLFSPAGTVPAEVQGRLQGFSLPSRNPSLVSPRQRVGCSLLLAPFSRSRPWFPCFPSATERRVAPLRGASKRQRHGEAKYAVTGKKKSLIKVFQIIWNTDSFLRCFN